jgi:4-amino-4-deoxy-L-arabinose transferase-like glycosyltransferase
MLLTESLFAFLTALSAYVYLDFVEKENAKSAALLGLVLGMAALTRPVSLLIVVPLLAWYVFERDRTPVRRRVRNAVTVLSMFILALVPWTVRNYLITEQIIPVASRGGHFFYSNTIASREEEVRDQMNEFGQANNDEPEKRDEAYIQLALRNIAEKPHLFVKNTLMTMLDFWYRGHSRSISIFNAIVNFALLFLAVPGILRLRRLHGALLVPFLIFILYYNICYGLLHAISRYSFPVIGFVMLFASFYLWHDAARNRHAGL